MNKHLLFITQVYPSALTGTTVKTRRTIEYLLENGFEVDVCAIHCPDMVKNKFSHKNLRIYLVEKLIFSKLSFDYFKQIFHLLFSLTPLRVKKMYDSKLGRLAYLLDKKNSYNYVFYDGFSTLQYAHKKLRKNIYIDDEDITDLLWKRMKKTKNPLLYFFFLSDYLKCLIYERRVLKNVSQIWSIAPNTHNRLKTLSNAKIFFMPTIVPERKNAFSAKSKDIVFTGLLSWMENVDGLKWFLDNFWSEVRKKYPKVRLFVVGQMAQPELEKYLEKFPGVELMGYVPDLRDIYKKSAVAIAPILINSGIKVKILTYLSYGLPVVSLEQATWGMSSMRGVVTTNESNFGKKLIKLLSDSNKRKIMSKQAQQNIAKYHSYKALEDFFIKTGIFNYEQKIL